ncbi:MAG TPA: hypothetical protein DDW52_01685 [Planctomycetaceae bacterium]|nr:hypothetical protein [Planctomycetaceae bacterium]
MIAVKYLRDTLKSYFRRAKDFCVYKILHADDPPHRLALGIAVGMFVTFMPAIGLQMVLSVFIAWLLRANKLVGVPLVWISNPVTIIPIYYPCYLLGCKLLGTAAASDDWARVEAAWQEAQGAASVTWLEKAQFYWNSILDVIWPLCAGCLVVGLTAGVLSYYISLFAIRSYRLRRWGQLMPPQLTPNDPTDFADAGNRSPDRQSHADDESEGNAA